MGSEMCIRDRDMQRRVPDISKIKQVLGWEPEINLDQIIKDIAAFSPK